MEGINANINKANQASPSVAMTRSISIPQSLLSTRNNSKVESGNSSTNGAGIYQKLTQKVPFLSKREEEEEEGVTAEDTDEQENDSMTISDEDSSPCNSRSVSSSSIVSCHRQHDDVSFSLIKRSFEELSINPGPYESEKHIDNNITNDMNSHIHHPRSTNCHIALQVPEILNLILEYVDNFNTIPHESAPKRRKPMSLQHALLLHGDSSATRQEWHRSQSESRKRDTTAKWHQQTRNNGAGLYSCLFVNKFWYAVSVRLLYKQLHFKKDSSWKSFLKQNCADSDFRPSLLVLHKLSETTQQSDIKMLGDRCGGNLEWLEFYTCPNIVPTKPLLSGGKITKIVLPGCSRVDDRTIALVAESCPALETLDLRACEKVSDRGLKFVAKHCRQLKLLNVGRTQRGELITHNGLKHIARRTQLTTLGAAGTAIEDRTVWDFAAYRGKSIERLSLNNCKLLTNKSVPRILKYTPNLSVLELRGCTQITEMRPIVKFKRIKERMGCVPLIEGCELFELRMKEAEWLIEMEVSRQVFHDCLEWIYAVDDDVDVYETGYATRVPEEDSNSQVFTQTSDI